MAKKKAKAKKAKSKGGVHKCAVSLGRRGGKKTAAKRKSKKK